MSMRLDQQPSAGPAADHHPTIPLRRDIEGLRAIAILLVVGYHVGLPGFSGGYIGVDMFFVLSGYLITMLLINEATTTGRLSLIGFYARRVRRLLPALACMLVVTVIVSFVIFAPIEQRPLAKSAFSTAAYASNIYFVQVATNYFADSVQSNPYLHTWSLAVEEQFYLAWPLIVMFALGTRKRLSGGLRPRRLRLVMLGIVLVSFGLSAWLTAYRQPWAFFLSPLRAWEFAVGGLGVGVARRMRPGSAPLAAAWRICAWLGLAGIIAATMLFNDRTSFPGFAALAPALATITMLCVGEADSTAWFVRLLSIRPLQEIGRLSYSWYLWHWPALAFGLALDPRPALSTRIGQVLVALVIAKLSYHLVENPIRRRRALAMRPAYSLALAALVTIVGLGGTYGWYQSAKQLALNSSHARFTRATTDWSPLYGRCMANVTEVAPKSCSFGDESAATTVVLFGDSHAAHWFPTLHAIAKEKDWRIITFIKTSCPSADIKDFFYSAIRRVYTECAEWRQAAIAAITRLQPQAIVFTNFAGHSLTPAEWQGAIDRVLRQFQAPGTKVIQIRDSPHATFNVPLCLARAVWRSWWRPAGGCVFERGPALWQEVYAAQQQAAASYPNVYSIDLTAELCPRTPCTVERDGMIMYSDSHHLTASFATTLAPVLGPQLDAIINGAGTSQK